MAGKKYWDVMYLLRPVMGHNVYITSQYFSPNGKDWTASSGNRTRAPPDRMWTLYHWAMESVHNMGVLVTWAPGRGQILCNYSTPPPTSKHPCIPTLHSGRGGGALPASPLPLNTCSHNTATRRPPHNSNTQQHTRTPLLPKKSWPPQNVPRNGS